jgi:type 1 glutamine amidotransferase
MKTFLALIGFLLAVSLEAAPMKALIIDGQNNHDFRSTTPHLKKVIEETGLFTVEVASTPGQGKDMSSFHPVFGDYQVIISNYNGEPWSQETRDAFEKYVREGGGFVSVHAADNAFPNWKAYNEMIAVGGWNNRNEKSGPYLRLRDGKFQHLAAPGPGGSHGKQHAFLMETRTPQHPIMAGLPEKWMHAKDELYDRLRGPGENVAVLASAFSAKEQNGTGENEPLLMTISYGKGRVFHTALGHNNGKDLSAQRCVGFIVTLQRGVEWAATGKVTQKVPGDFPTAEKVSVRE